MTSPNTIIADMQLVETNLRQQIAHLNDEIAGLKSDVAYVENQREELVNLLQQGSESIGRFVSDEGWKQTDMDTMDSIDSAIARVKGGS